MSEIKYEAEGASARVIEDVMNGREIVEKLTFVLCNDGRLKESREIYFPHDYDDFSRCKQLLDNHPEWIDDFKIKMSKVNTVWNKIMDIWFELNWLFIDNKKKEINDKLKECCDG